MSCDRVENPDAAASEICERDLEAVRRELDPPEEQPVLRERSTPLPCSRVNTLEWARVMRRAVGEDEIRVASSDDREYEQPPAQSAGCGQGSARVHPQRSTVGEAEADVAEPEM
jgi:hypothetical protein